MSDSVGSIPDRIPGPPAVDVTYDAIEKRERIGAGGNADVYRAVFDGTHDVALKEPRFQGTIQRATLEQFTDEAETWDRLDDHDHVVGVLGWGTEPLPWIALEYMDGGNLRAYVGETSVSQSLWITGRIASGVRHAHRHGVAHLDLKPANVLFRETGQDTWAVPKVGDWGLSKLLIEQSRSVEGLSPEYAAPEQFDAEEYGDPDDFTDIYQLGAIAYELLTGRPPFDGSPTEIMRATLDDQPDAPTDVDPSLPVAVDEILSTALAKRKEDRYETVAHFRQAVEDCFEDVTEASGVAGPVPGGGESASAAGDADSDSSTDGDDGSAARSADAEETEADAGQSRRRLLKVGAGVAVLGGAGAAAYAGTRLGGGGTDGRSLQQAGGGGTTRQPDGSESVFDAWLSGANHYQGEPVDARGQSVVQVDVGAGEQHLAFDPPALIVSPGTRVVWQWTGSGGEHDVVFEDRDIESGLSGESGHTFSQTFEETGTYRYYCTPHKAIGMKGAIDVRGERVTPATTTPAPDDSVTFGVVAPLSGRLPGTAFRKGAVLAARQLAEDDGFDYEIETVVADSSSEGWKETVLAPVIDDEIDYLVGGLDSETVGEVAQQAINTGTIYAPAHPDPRITGKSCSKWVFRAETNFAQLGNAMGDFAAGNLGSSVWFHTIGYVYESLTERIQAKMAALDRGYKLIETTRSADFDVSDFSGAIQRILDSKANLLVLPFFGKPLVTFLKQATNMGLKEQVSIIVPAIPQPTTNQDFLLGGLGGVYRAVRFLPNSDVGKAFVEAHREAFGAGVPSDPLRVGYQSVRMLAKGIQRAGSTDPATVAETLPGYTIETVLGDVAFRECDHQAVNPVWIAKYTGTAPTWESDIVHEYSGQNIIRPCDETGCSQ